MEDIEGNQISDESVLPEELLVEEATIVTTETVSPEPENVLPKHVDIDDDVIAKMNREELKKELQLRGQKISGKKMEMFD